MIEEILKVAEKYIGKIPAEMGCITWTDLIEKQEIEINAIAQKFNYTRCSEKLKDKQEITFKEWKRQNKYTECTDGSYFISNKIGYVDEKELVKRYVRECAL